MITPRIFNGARDFLPDEMVGREALVDLMKNVFRKYGFLPMETPALEFMEILAGKYGDEEKLIYKLAYKGGNELALRYDLTVPLSRVMGMHPHISKPFKRYQIQPVWRADRPQPNQGRFREFYQCDVDTVGTGSLVADAEIIALTHEMLQTLGFTDFKIRINHRKILTGLIEYTGFPEGEEGSVCRSLDKLLKIGWDGVRQELKEKGYETACIDRLQEFFSGKESLDINKLNIRTRNANLDGGIGELLEIRSLSVHLGVDPDRLENDLTLARGLNYYTGCIYESRLVDSPHIGSLTGGGRYDSLIGTFSKQDIPAVGTTIGLDRIYTAMQQLNMPLSETTATDVLVTVFDASTREENLKLAGELRQEGLRVELFLDKAKIGRQFEYADRKGIPLVVVQGGDELAQGTVQIKDLKTGTQQTTSRSGIGSVIKLKIKE